jgi:hypothetical protein
MRGRTLALALWTREVAENSRWDHKPVISQCFRPRSGGAPQAYHAYGERRYFYDIWSNIHYGYVGKAAGFSDSMLLDGAGLEQIGSTLLKGRRPVRHGRTTAHLRDWDDINDRLSIELGITLYQRHPAALSQVSLEDAVLKSNIKFELALP